MEQKELEQLSKDELLEEAKRLKSTKTYDAVIIGLLIGISIYSSVTNGFGLLTFLPLVYIPIAGRNNAKRQAVKELLTEKS